MSRSITPLTQSGVTRCLRQLRLALLGLSRRQASGIYAIQSLHFDCHLEEEKKIEANQGLHASDK